MKNENLSENTTIKIDYKEYPEFMFAMIAAYLPPEEGHDIRRIAGKVVFRYNDNEGRTYKNGVLHSYEDNPAVIDGKRKEWYKDGEIHRDGDFPAVIDGYFKNWCKNGKLHREGDLPAIIKFNDEDNSFNYQVWFKNGKRHREGDLPAFIEEDRKEWYVNGALHREGDLPAIIDGEHYKVWYKNGYVYRNQV
jgi:antitoxin component YwqK of YwqJK toxin-antitoxin module